MWIQPDPHTASQPPESQAEDWLARNLEPCLGYESDP